jgi:hypothetical protein
MTDREPTISLQPDFFTIRVDLIESGVEGEPGYSRKRQSVREYRSGELPEIVLFEEVTATIVDFGE